MSVGTVEEERILSLRDLLRILRKRLWVIVLIVVLAVGTAVGLSMVQTPQYEATIKTLVGQDQGITDNPQEALALQNLTETMAEAANSRPIAEAVIQQLGLQSTPEEILGSMSVEPIPGTQFVQMSYRDTSPERAQRVVNAIGSVFSEQISEASSDASAITATVWEPAEEPNEPVSPNPVRNGLLALMLGLILGVGLAFLLEYLDDSWRSPEEAEQVSGIPTFGVIPEFEGPKGKKG